MPLAYETPVYLTQRWAREDVAHIEFERMKALGASDRLALESAIRAFERVSAAALVREQDNG